MNNLKSLGFTLRKIIYLMESHDFISDKSSLSKEISKENPIVITFVKIDSNKEDNIKDNTMFMLCLNRWRQVRIKIK